MKRGYARCSGVLVAFLVAIGVARAQMPPGQASTGPIEDTSYAAGLPGALFGLMKQSGPERWQEYLRQRKAFTLYRFATGFEAGRGCAPSYLLSFGYADFRAGFDAAILGDAGQTDKIGAEFRLVSFSPGRKEMVDALTQMEAEVAAAFSDAVQYPGVRSAPSVPMPPAATLSDAVQNPGVRSAPNVPTHPAAEAFVAWSEKPHLALRARWLHLDGRGDQGSVGLSASILRPLPLGGGPIPSGIEIGANLDYASLRWRDKSRIGLRDKSRIGLWDPSYGITVRDQVFRLTNGGPEVSRWRWQAGVIAGVRNEANDRVPLAFFVRIRLAPSTQIVYTPLEIAERTALVTFTARRDGGGQWLYGIQAAWLR